ALRTRREVLRMGLAGAAAALAWPWVGSVCQHRQDVDVLVVGSGPAGLAAAWEARASGARVRVLERCSVPGGGARYAGMMFGAGTGWQQAAGVVDTPEQALADWETVTDGSADDPMVRQFVSTSGQVIDWLVALGGHCSNVAVDRGAGQVARMHAVYAPGVLATLIAALGSCLQVGCRVDELILEEGRVVGAHYQQGGRWHTVRARSVVLATGGFGRDLGRVLRDRPALRGLPLVFECAPCADGGGHDLLEQAGAAWQNSGHVGCYVHSIRDFRPGMQGEALWVPNLARSLLVGLDGRRVMAESERSTFRLLEGLLRAPGRRLFAIYPRQEVQASGAMVPAYNWRWFGTPESVPLDELMARGLCRAFSSLEELALACGIHPQQLAFTFERYQSFARLGQDLEYGKDPADLAPFSAEEFFVIEVLPGVAKCFGGARLDPEARVLDGEGRPIPGLFAAGEVAGMLGTPAVGRGFSGSVSACYYTGRLAGLGAAREALQG
ncbi:MAG TPA: FAD-binding protein, partial [Candidatus Nitrosotenuis sp.]|nr:FAD-binding protein [Candidatus Nitrosotenuis sp.]